MAGSRKTKVIALSVGKALARVIGLAVTMVMVRLLVKEDVAAYQQTLLAYATVAPILTLGVGQGMYYFLPSEKDRVRGRLMDGLTVLGLMGLIFSVFLAFGGNELLAQRFSNPKVANMLLWMIPYAIITTPGTVTSDVLVAREKVNLAAVFGVVRQLLIGVVTVIPLIIWQTAEASLIGNVVAAILMAFAGIGLMIRSTPNDSAFPSVVASKELVVFAIPLALAGMIGAISMQLDKLIVAFLCPPDEFAVYALGAIQLPLIGIVTGAITAVTLVEMRKSVSDGNKEAAVRLFRKTAQKSALIILPAMTFFMITADSFIELLYTNEYADSAIPFRWYLSMLPIRTVYFGSLIIALGHSQFILYSHIGTLIFNLILTVLLVSLVGAWGAVAATVAVVYLWTVPVSLYFLGFKTEKRWYEILPVKDFMIIFFHMIPIGTISVLLVLLIDNYVVEFVAVAVVFALFFSWYWNGRIYSIKDSIRKLGSFRSGQ